MFENLLPTSPYLYDTNKTPSSRGANSAPPLLGKMTVPADYANGASIQQTSANSNVLSPSSEDNGWFEMSNSGSGLGLGLDHAFADAEEPPYFHTRENSSSSTFEVGRNVPPNSNPQFGPMFSHHTTNGNNVDEYRSVIDDLTIENRKLKERLRRLEGSSHRSPHLEKDKLFELKFHELPWKKRRELEEMLRTFVGGIEGSKNVQNITVSAKKTRHQTSGNFSHNPSSTSTSKSRPIDSAYASLINSRPTSTSKSDQAGHEQKSETPTSDAKEQQVQTFLHNIPKGLLPKHSVIMTERQKEKAVVRRLEQLFTGKTGVSIGEHSHPMQQQEVSKSATRADRAADGLSSLEGIREAHILPYEMDIDVPGPGLPVDGSSHEMPFSRQHSDVTTPDDSLRDISLYQRPTRPLDLDPDRAQIPADNIDYIRHLGLSTPRLAKGDSTDAATTDTSDWVPLNLLMSMAQLHIINVTPDFVRSALQNVSEMFQLSPDGQRVRWSGGTEGTRLSSDSGDSSGRNNSPPDSDSFDEADRKRRRLNVGRFAKAPVDTSDSRVRVGGTRLNTIHYKPLFHRQRSSDSSLDDSDSEHGQGNGRGQGKFSKLGQFENQSFGSSSRGRQRDEGPIIFYSGAPFCTDLSGDSGNIITPQHVTGVGKDGYSNHTQNALGCTPRKRPNAATTRTPSGSSILFRPFKDDSKGSELLQTEHMRPKTPELLADDDLNLDSLLAWSPGLTHLEQPPRTFSACGIGGTRPADHFSAKIETRRTILDNSTRVKLSKFSAPGYAPRKVRHTIPKPILNVFHQPQRRKSSYSVPPGLASLSTVDTPALGKEELPVKIKLVSAKFSHLEPSPLPPPACYYAGTSSSETESEYGS